MPNKEPKLYLQVLEFVKRANERHGLSYRSLMEHVMQPYRTEESRKPRNIVSNVYKAVKYGIGKGVIRQRTNKLYFIKKIPENREYFSPRKYNLRNREIVIKSIQKRGHKENLRKDIPPNREHFAKPTTSKTTSRKITSRIASSIMKPSRYDRTPQRSSLRRPRSKLINSDDLASTSGLVMKDVEPSFPDIKHRVDDPIEIQVKHEECDDQDNQDNTPSNNKNDKPSVANPPNPPPSLEDIKEEPNPTSTNQEKNKKRKIDDETNSETRTRHDENCDDPSCVCNMKK